MTEEAMITDPEELKFFKENREKYDVLVLKDVAFVSFSNYYDGIRAMKANDW